MYFSIFYFFLLVTTILQRILELRLSHRNESVLQNNGAFEIGKNHFSYMKFTHTLFFIFIFLEWTSNHFSFALPTIKKNTQTVFVIFFLCQFLLGQSLRCLSQKALKNRWTAKVFAWPKHPPLKNGIYRWGYHPNYVGVCLEIMSLPLIMGLWKTALFFTFLNGLILYVRVTTENRVLKFMNNA